MFKPALPPYEISEWKAKPFADRVRMVCQAWAVQGYGTPVFVYSFYLLKIVFYVWMWCFFCSFSPGIGHLGTISSWWLEPVAFQKALLWSMLFEGLGLGCGSGPLTGRYFPPFGGFLYFLRPGTTKVSFWPKLPFFGRSQRTLADVVLYLLHCGFLVYALISPTITIYHVLPTLILLPLMGLSDKAIFLSARSEHYLTALICLMFASEWVSASKWVWLAVWVWAATSKLNRHFPSVVAVMCSNSPFTLFGPFRKWMYRSFPDDLRPSKLAVLLAHMGTVVEFCFPFLLVFGQGGTITWVGLTIMLLFHVFITSNVPMGVPIEWNVMMVYGAFFLFGAQSGVSMLDVSSPLLIGSLVTFLLLIPLLGNLFPAHFSFLSSMRYYAGNWPYSVWLFKGDCSKKLDEHLVKFSPRVSDQLRILYDEDVITAVISKVIAFRAMHLQGRAIQSLVPKMVDDIDDFEQYEYLDGELVAGVVIGWNFGDGHLHHHQLLEAIQEQCQFAESELRCLFVESQPMGGKSMSWKIVDAAIGVLEEGEMSVKEMDTLQPWPT